MYCGAEVIKNGALECFGRPLWQQLVPGTLGSNQRKLFEAGWRHLGDVGCHFSVGATADTFRRWQLGASQD